MNIPADLIPGDILLCAGDEVVRRFTNSIAGHVAVYVDPINGVPSVVTSLTRTGVGIYPLAEGADYIVQVRRPIGVFDINKAMGLFLANYSGKPYGWGDCANDVGLPNLGGGWNCSHTSSQFLEDGECAQFDRQFPKTKITPRDLQIGILAVTIPLN